MSSPRFSAPVITVKRCYTSPAVISQEIETLPYGWRKGVYPNGNVYWSTIHGDVIMYTSERPTQEPTEEELHPYIGDIGDYYGEDEFGPPASPCFGGLVPLYSPRPCLNINPHHGAFGNLSDEELAAMNSSPSARPFSSIPPSMDFGGEGGSPPYSSSSPVYSPSSPAYSPTPPSECGSPTYSWSSTPSASPSSSESLYSSAKRSWAEGWAGAAAEAKAVSKGPVPKRARRAQQGDLMEEAGSLVSSMDDAVRVNFLTGLCVKYL